MDAVRLTYTYLCSTFLSSNSAVYNQVYEENNSLLLAVEVYNLFIVATIITLFIWFFRIAIRERHIRELSTHLASNNALVFDTLGSDVDILRQFTPEHLMKYLEYNSGTKPIPIEQIQIPFSLNRESLHIHSSIADPSTMEFKIDGNTNYRMKLFWSIPSHVYKKCCKDLGRMICVNDPTFRREFLNPFLDPRESQKSISFSDIIKYLQSNTYNGCTPVVDGDGTESFKYSIPDQLLVDLPNYHLDAKSLAIFCESTTRSNIRRMDSQSNLLRPLTHSPVYNSIPSIDGNAEAEKPGQDMLPLVIIIWNAPKAPSPQAPQTPEVSESAQPTLLPQHSLSKLKLRSRTQSSTIIKEEKVETDEKKPFVLKQRERRQSTDVGVLSDEKPSFVSINIIHFLRNHTPTLIRRLVICPDGVFVPRSIYTSNGDNQKNKECIICFSNPNDVVLLPCRHQLVCRFCVCMIKRCPLCRSAINYYLTEGAENELGHSYNSESTLV